MEKKLKVYEFAKELGVDSISLLDKLKALNIFVKNHMSELNETELTIARNAFKKTSETKKSAVRTKKKASDPLSQPTDVKEKKSTIVRRRPKQPDQEKVSEESLKALVEEPIAAELPIETTPSIPIEPIEPHSPEPNLIEEDTPMEPNPAEKEESPKILEKPKTKAPIVLTPRPVAPRKSILKIVSPVAPPPRPVIKPAPETSSSSTHVKGTTTQDSDGFRIIKMTKENLDEMVQEEAARKKPFTKEAELSPEDIRFADYRKKELFFLPKKKKIPTGKPIKHTQITVAKAQKRIIEMHETIAVTELANQLSIKANELVRKLFSMGHMTNINQSLDFETASLIAAEYQYEVRSLVFNETKILKDTSTTDHNLTLRPPVVTIMGHVDHGKTTLLDTIRSANVVATEAGGITQHIGAYTVEYQNKHITFIDTPGHEAFTQMRARGANLTDIVVLVVSADDGVMPQTREAISHATAAKVPMIVAVNKIDKPGANPQKIQQALAELGLLAEEWGGETMFIPISALKNLHIDKLLEAILLQSELLDLKANHAGRAQGIVLEAKIKKGRGPMITGLIKEGTLRIGDPIVAGCFFGKVRALTNDQGQNVQEAKPGFAVEILGLNGLPNSGDLFDITPSEENAKQIAHHRLLKQQSSLSSSSSTKVSLDDLFAKIQSGDIKELNIVLKADAYGSVEVLKDTLAKLSTEKVKIKILLAAAGGITESDVLLASASKAIILGFNVRPETKARQLADAEHIEIKSYKIIYELIDDVKKAMVGLLDKKKIEKFLGRAQVRQVFSVPKIGTIAGSFVLDGKILRGANVRLLRDSKILYEGKMSSLKRFKDDIKEVASGFECGIGIAEYNDLKLGDIIEAYQIEFITPELS